MKSAGMITEQYDTNVKRESDNGYKPIVMLLCGLFCLLLTGVKLTSTAIHVNNALVTDGIVTGISREANVAGNDFDTYLMVEFSTSESELVRFKDIGPPVDIGDKVEVLYNPVNPSDARIRDFWQLWGWWSLYFGVSAGMTIWGLTKLLSKDDVQ